MIVGLTLFLSVVCETDFGCTGQIPGYSLIHPSTTPSPLLPLPPPSPLHPVSPTFPFPKFPATTKDSHLEQQRTQPVNELLIQLCRQVLWPAVDDGGVVGAGSASGDPQSG